MKINKFYITLICTILVLPAFANNIFKERTDDWLQSENNMRTDNWLQTESWLQTTMARPPAIGADEAPSDDPTFNATPLGNEVSVLLIFGLIYGIYVFRRKKMCQ